MGIAEILKLEVQNTNIFLHKEGIFWRAYEHQAFMFCENLKKYQPTKKYYKNVKSEVVYIGLPNNALDNILFFVKDKNIDKNDNQITLSEFNIKINEYEAWKTNIELTVSNNSKTNVIASLPNTPEIIEKVRNIHGTKTKRKRPKYFLFVTIL